jgi:hypothetical protein
MNIAAIAPKLRKLIPRLGTNHVGEAIATLAAIDRVLKSGGHDWHDLTAALCTTPKIVELDEDWRATLRFCAKNSAHLSERELHFIATLANWRGALTEKQKAWLDAIADRLRGEQ